MKKIFIIVFIALSLSSCDNYLDVKPYGRTIPKTAEEFSAFIHAQLYRIDQGENTYFMDNSTTISYFDLSAGDDFEASLTSNSGRNLDVYIGTILGFKSFPSEAYSSLYQTIRDCNIVIGEMKEEGTDEADKVRATAYAMRAACYYQLLRWFCDVPEKKQYGESVRSSARYPIRYGRAPGTQLYASRSRFDRERFEEIHRVSCSRRPVPLYRGCF